MKRIQFGVLFTTLSIPISIGSYIEYKSKSINKINLVFDLDHTLIHSKENDKINECNYQSIRKFDCKDREYSTWIRPFSYNILSLLCKFNNVYLFTASTQSYADGICNKLFNGIFIKRLYRESVNDNGKDMQKLNIDLPISILIDDKFYNKYDNQYFYHIPQYYVYKSYDIEILKLFMFVLKVNLFGLDKCYNKNFY